MSRTVVITGATGFIGHYLVEEGIRRGYHVIAWTRNKNSAKSLLDLGAEVVQINLLDGDSLKEWMAKNQVDYFIHNAGVTKLSVYQKEDYFNGNVVTTRHVLEALRDTSCRKFAYTSSLEASGPGDSDSLAPKQVNNGSQPITDYGQSKYQAEEIIRRQSIPYLIFQPTAVYGPLDKGFAAYFDLLKAHVEPYFISKKQLLSFIYVKDLARLYFDGLASPHCNKTYFAADGDTYTVAEFNQKIKALLHTKTVKIVLPQMALAGVAKVSETLSNRFGIRNFFSQERFKQVKELNWSCDITETVKDLGFKPAYDLDRGLAETMEWYLRRHAP